MKIVFLLPRVGMSGGIKVATIYAKELVRKGHEVTLISPPPNQMPLRSKIKSLLRGRGWPATVLKLKSHLDNAGLDHRVLERPRPIIDSDVPEADVVVATWWETAEWLSRLSPSKGAKAYFVQGHEVFSNMPVERVKATYKMPLHRIVISTWLKNIMEREYGDFQTDLVPNSVDPMQFHALVRGKQERPTVGFLYSGSGNKGVDVSLQVVKQLRKQVPNLRVISFGAVPVNPDENWDPEIEYEHSPAQERLRELYAQCDVWLSASRSEGFNLTAMEAMVCRTPVASTRTGWPEEAIKDRVNGVLVDIDDAVGLAAGAAWILSLGDDAWRAVSLCAYETATTGSWAHSAELFESALKRCRERTLTGEIG